MPDLNPLAAFGGGLSRTLFGGLLQERHREEDDKRREQATRLAAYHALLEHPDTPENEIPNILGSIAREVKAEKEFAPILDNMRAGMSRRVPTGPSSQMPVQPTRTNELAGLPADTSGPSSVTVPGPSAEFGSLTQSQARRASALEDYEAQQSIQTDRAVQLNKLTTDRQLQIEQSKEIARQARMESEYKLKLGMLEPKARLEADKQRNQFEQSLLAQLGHAPSEEERAWARTKAGDMVINLTDATLMQRRAAAEASSATAKNRLAQIKHWNNQDAAAIQRLAVDGLTASAVRQFNLETKDAFSELSGVKSEIRRLKLLKAAAPTDTRFDSLLQEQEAKQDELQLQIKDARDAVKQSGVPTAPQGGGAGAGSQRQQKYRIDWDKLGLTP